MVLEIVISCFLKTIFFLKTLAFMLDGKKFKRLCLVPRKYQDNKFFFFFIFDCNMKNTIENQV